MLKVKEESQIVEKTGHEKIVELQELLLQHRCDMPEAEHMFCPGVYARKFEMPASMIVIGRMHKHQHFMIVLSGHAEIVSGDEKREVRGGDMFISDAGTKRAVRTIEDTVFLTIHHNPDNTENIDDIEYEHIEDEDFKPEYHKEYKGEIECQ